MTMMMMMLTMMTMIVVVVVVVLMEILNTGYLVGTAAVKTTEITRPEAKVTMSSPVRRGSVYTVIYDRRNGFRFVTVEQTFATVTEPPPRCT